MGGEEKETQGVATREMTFDDLRMEIGRHPPAPPPSWPSIAQVKRAPIGQLIAWILWLPPITKTDPDRIFRLYVFKLICFRAQEYRRGEGSWKGEELAVTEEDLENAFNEYAKTIDLIDGSIQAKEPDKKDPIQSGSESPPSPQAKTPESASD